MKHINFLLLILVFTISQKSLAQTHGNVSCEIGVPINDFYDKLKDVSGGFKCAVYFPVQKQSMLFIGGGLGFGVFGTKTQNVHEHLDVYCGNNLIDQVPIDFRVATNNNFFNGYVAARVKYPGRIIQPYAEARIGINNFYTHTSVYDETYNRMFTCDQASNQINNSSQLNSLTYSVGGEGGVIIKFRCWGINLGVAYLVGGQAKYYSKNQIQQWTVTYSGDEQNWNSNDVDPQTVALNPSAVPLKSYTDMLLCTAGFTFGLCPRTKSAKHKSAASSPAPANQNHGTPNYNSNIPLPPRLAKPPVPLPHINPNGNTHPSPIPPPKINR